MSAFEPLQTLATGHFRPFSSIAHAPHTDVLVRLQLAEDTRI